MSGTLFKLTKPPDGLTRRVLFDPKPSWDQLADKIESLYGIPKDDVGVTTQTMQSMRNRGAGV